MHSVPEVRALVESSARSALSPFLRDQRGFAVCGKGRDDLEFVGVIEDEHIPTRNDVTSGRFAFGAIATTFDTNGSAVLDNEGEVIYPYPEQGGDSAQGGYAKLAGRAAQQLVQVRRERALAALERRLRGRQFNRDTGATASFVLVLRIGELPEPATTLAASLIRGGIIHCAAALDVAQSDLSAKRIFRSIESAFKSDPDEYVCKSDIQVTSMLRVGERTGVLPVMAEATALAGLEIGQVYQRVDDSFPAIRVEILTRVGQLNSSVEAVTAALLRFPRIAKGDDLLAQLFTSDAAVPVSARPAMQALISHRSGSKVARYFDALKR